MAIYPSVMKFYWYFSNMVLSNTTMLQTVQVVQILECARKCKNANTCQSFFFDTLDNKCMLHSGIVLNTDSRLIQQHGMSYYTVEKAKSCFKSADSEYEGPDFCAQYVFSRQTWLSALEACEGDGGTLVRIHSDTKNTLLKNTYGTPTDNIWIDGRYQSAMGMWMRTDGTQIGGFDDWMPGQPDGSTNENCMAMTSKGWADFPCSFRHPFLCELPPV